MPDKQLNIRQAEVVKTLVAHYNGTNVGRFSIMLEMPTRRDEAQEWFKIRSTLGMDGYLTMDEATSRVIERLYGEM